MNVPEMLKNNGTWIKSAFENEEITKALAETIKENKGKIINGLIALGALYILKDKKFKAEYEETLNGDRKIKFETE